MEHIEHYYMILGLSASVSDRELKRAYREWVKAWHPDRFQDDPVRRLEAEEKLKEINDAYAKVLWNRRNSQRVRPRAEAVDPERRPNRSSIPSWDFRVFEYPYHRIIKKIYGWQYGLRAWVELHKNGNVIHHDPALGEIYAGNINREVERKTIADYLMKIGISVAATAEFVDGKFWVKSDYEVEMNPGEEMRILRNNKVRIPIKDFKRKTMLSMANSITIRTAKIKECPVCRRVYDSSWRICLFDNTGLANRFPEKVLAH